MKYIKVGMVFDYYILGSLICHSTLVANLQIFGQLHQTKLDFLQVATTLLVAGSTLTFWIPVFASTSSYPSIVQNARLLV